MSCVKIRQMACDHCGVEERLTGPLYHSYKFEPTTQGGWEKIGGHDLCPACALYLREWLRGGDDAEILAWLANAGGGRGYVLPKGKGFFYAKF